MANQKEKSPLFSFTTIVFLILIAVIILSGLNVISYVQTKMKADSIPSVIAEQNIPEDTAAITGTEEPAATASEEDTVSVPAIENRISAIEPDGLFHVFITAEPEGGDSTGAHLSITKKDGTAYKSVELNSVRYPLALDLNKDLLLKFSKKGFETKIVYFNTHVPKGREKEEFARFIVDVGLAKKPKGSTAEIIKYPGGVEYDDASEDFTVKK